MSDNRVGGYCIGNARWKGTQLAPLLVEAGIGSAARKGWNKAGERGIHARFDVPEDLKQLRGSSFVLTGYALGGTSGVRAVEISTGQGWVQTDLFSNPSTAA